ncbi:hypothetical protein WDW37_19755 [Bdellovibrionota bacterium FG-1]
MNAALVGLGSLSSIILALLPLRTGLYQMTASNSTSICPQKVRPYFSEQALTGLEVTYVGDCLGMGTYVYGCDRNEAGPYLCGDAQVAFRIKDPNHYRWENLNYAFWAEFEWTQPYTIPMKR